MTLKRLLALLHLFLLGSTTIVKAFAPTSVITTNRRGSLAEPSLTQLESSIPYDDLHQHRGPISPPSFGGFIEERRSSTDRTSQTVPPSAVPATTTTAQLDRYGIYQVTTYRQLQNLIEDNPDKALILQFYAPWCQACKAFHHKFRQFCSRSQITTGADASNVVVAQVRCSKRSDPLCQQMGVTRFPSIQCYQSDGNLVQDLACGNSNNSTPWSELQQQVLTFAKDPDAFVKPPREGLKVTKWLSSCVQCVGSICVSVVRYPFAFLLEEEQERVS